VVKISRAAIALAALVAFAVLVAVYVRVHYGVDVSDESFYLAMPLRFVLGDRPFIDELNVAQTAGVIVWPFVGAFYKLTGGTDGLVLAARVALIVLQGAVGFTVFRALRRFVDVPAAILIGTACVLFWPANLPGLSYNTLGATFFTLAMFLPLAELLDGRPPPPAIAFGTGASLALASFSYPTLVVPTMFYSVVFLLMLRGKTRPFWFYLGGGGSVVAVLLPLFVRAGVWGLRRVIAYSFSGGVGGEGKLRHALAQIWDSTAVSPWMAPLILLLVGVGCRRAPRVMRFALFALPLLACTSAYSGLQRGAAWIIYYSMLAIPVGLGLEDRKLANRLLWGVWAPAFVGGLVTIWTSSNGAIAAAIGLLPASLATSALIARASMEQAPGARWLGAPAGAALVALAILVFYQYDGECLYRDGPKIEDLPVRMESGPFRGLWTTDFKAQYIEDIQKDVGHLARRGGRALFYFDFPAGYLMTAMRPAAASAWIFPNPFRSVFDGEAFQQYFKETGRVLVVKVRYWWPRYEILPIDRAVWKCCDEKVHRPNFDLWVEKR
jgi:hypothetical protein